MSNKTVQYHIFCDRLDYWEGTRKGAENVFKKLKEEGEENIRMYKCIWDEKEDDFEEDIYIKGIGGFPF